MTKITQFTADTAPTNTDYIVTVDSETGVNKKVLLSSLFGSLPTSLSYVTTAVSNPYKFRAWRSAAANTGSSVFAKIVMDTENYDTNNNFATGTYTVPVTGFYHFDWGMQVTTSGAQYVIASLMVNGAEVSRGTRVNSTSLIVGSHGSDTISLTAADTVEMHGYADTARPLEVTGGSASNFLAGFLVSRT